MNNPSNWEPDRAKGRFRIGDQVRLGPKGPLATVIEKCPASPDIKEEPRYVVRWTAEGEDRHANVPQSLLESDDTP